MNPLDLLDWGPLWTGIVIALASYILWRDERRHAREYRAEWEVRRDLYPDSSFAAKHPREDV